MDSEGELISRSCTKLGKKYSGDLMTFSNFELIEKIGSGDLGTVYLCRKRNSDDRSLYAMKVVDKEAIAVKKKVERAEMERKILKMVDHPFLPNLYAEFEYSHFSCIVMEYCSGGDLHSLRLKQHHKRFSLGSARFYAAEVLITLEYLHMLGIIYRDLKPENVLVRSDGHIMLTDFDLSLCSDAIPVVESLDYSQELAANSSKPSRHTIITCLSNRLFRSRKVQTLSQSQNPIFVAEPVGARSCSFVGTHEYVSPEVASGRSHGNAVDWWAFGIFIYEMIYGQTPFVAASNETTLRNIVNKSLLFPTDPTTQFRSVIEFHAQDLISKLLNKDPISRLGSKRGAADVKSHPFFKGLNWALIRSIVPYEVQGLRRQKTTPLLMNHDQKVNNSKRRSTTFDYF